MGLAFKALLIDDDEDILTVYDQAFEAAGFQTTLASSGEDGAQLITSQKFDVIICDLAMAGMNGIELTAIIKTNILNWNTPMYIISGTLDNQSLDKLQGLGIARCIPKPPVLSDLIKDISARLSPFFQVQNYKPEVLEIFQTAAKETLVDYFEDSINFGEPELIKGNKSIYPMTATVALFGQKIYGSITLSSEKGFTQELAEMLFGQSIEGDCEEFLSGMLGELSNQVAGSLRRCFARRKVDLVIGLPEVIIAPSILPRKVSNPATRISCQTKNQNPIAIDLCLGDPNALKMSLENSAFEIFEYDAA